MQHTTLSSALQVHWCFVNVVTGWKRSVWGLYILAATYTTGNLVIRNKLNNIVVGAEIMYLCGGYLVCHCHNKYWCLATVRVNVLFLTKHFLKVRLDTLNIEVLMLSLA